MLRELPVERPARSEDRSGNFGPQFGYQDRRDELNLRLDGVSLVIETRPLARTGRLHLGQFRRRHGETTSAPLR